MKRSLFLVAISGVLATLLGCATIATGTSQLMTINSNTDSAEVMIDNKLVGKTPFSGKVPKNGKILTVQKNGYTTKTIALSKNLEGIFWGNIITGGTIGSITDFATGAAYSYAPASYQVDLVAAGQSPASFKSEVELRRFVLVHYPELLREASTADKTYTRTLVGMLGSKESEAALMAWVGEEVMASRGDRVGFSALIVARKGT